MISQAFRIEHDEEAFSLGKGLSVFLREPPPDGHLAPFHPLDPGFQVGVGTEGEHAPEVHLDVGRHDRVTGQPGGRAHRFVENGGDGPAVGVARGAFGSGSEPGSSHEPLILGASEIRHPEAALGRLAGNERAPPSLEIGRLDGSPPRPGSDFRGMGTVIGHGWASYRFSDPGPPAPRECAPDDIIHKLGKFRSERRNSLWLSVMTVTDPQNPSAATDDWFRTLAETTATAIFVYDDERFLYANRAAQELSGYTQEELTELSPADLAHPDHLDRIVERLEQRRRGETMPPQVEVKILTKNGDTRWLEIAASPLDLGGELKVLGSAVDITDRKRTEMALRESEQRYRQIFEKNRAVKLLLDPVTGEIVEATPSAAEFYGYSRDELTRMFIWDINVLPEAKSRQKLSLAQREECNHFLFQHRLASGEERTVEVDSSPIDIQGRRLLYAIIHDVTEREKVRRALRREKERAQVTLASIGDGVIRTDARGCIDYLNPVAERLTGWSDEEGRGLPLTEVFQVVDETSREPLDDPVALCLERQGVVELPGTTVLIRRDGTEFAVRDTVAPIREPDGRISGVVLVFKDVTRLQGLERRMSYLAHHDPLTGLLNRTELEERLRECLTGSRHAHCPHTLLHLDLDEFRVINDTAGHLAGDEMLREIADLLRGLVRDWDAVARLGSDEFGILLVDLPMEEARRRAEAIRSEVERFRVDWENRRLRVGVSVGMVCIDGSSDEAQEVLRAADAACHVAKELGRNRIHEFDPNDTAIAERSGSLQWLPRLHRALDNHRFDLVRQPIRALNGKRPLLYELLLRLREEDGSWIASETFFPAAERYHLAPALDRWVVRHAFERIRDHDATFTLNLSGQSLSEEGFLSETQQALAESGADPRRICFEITETAAIGHLPQATRFISALRRQGCRFVLDDFGSGLSSFAYLKNLSVDFLKIDQVFVRDMGKSRIQRALVKSMHQLGQELGISTIAEGVETQQAHQALREIGVDYAQGFWVGRPERWE